MTARRILVTRPVGQAGHLCGLLETAGHEAIALPTIEILNPADSYRLEALTDTLEDYDLAVFVSVNAVRMGIEFILNQREWPGNTRIATVGASSAEALLPYGLSVDLVPEHQFNSEALLALDEMQDMSGQCVVISAATVAVKCCATHCLHVEPMLTTWRSINAPVRQWMRSA